MHVCKPQVCGVSEEGELSPTYAARHAAAPCRATPHCSYGLSFGRRCFVGHAIASAVAAPRQRRAQTRANVYAPPRNKQRYAIVAAMFVRARCRYSKRRRPPATTSQQPRLPSVHRSSRPRRSALFTYAICHTYKMPACPYHDPEGSEIYIERERGGEEIGRIEKRESGRGHRHREGE